MGIRRQGINLPRSLRALPDRGHAAVVVGTRSESFGLSFLVLCTRWVDGSGTLMQPAGWRAPGNILVDDDNHHAGRSHAWPSFFSDVEIGSSKGLQLRVVWCEFIASRRVVEATSDVLSESGIVYLGLALVGAALSVRWVSVHVPVRLELAFCRLLQSWIPC
jgi:hypothetical protein